MATVIAAQVNLALAAGNYEAAMDTSRKARTWSTAALVAGLVGGLI